MTTNIFGYEFEHIASARAVGDPVRAYAVTMEDGWCIKPPQIADGNVYKTSTYLYSHHDMSLVVIIPVSEIPEGAVVAGGNNKPETETM